MLGRLLDATRHLRKLNEVAELHQGLQYNAPIEKFVSKGAKKGYVPALWKVRDGLEPYVTLEPIYLRIEDHIMLYKAHLRPWERPKVIANAARLTRGPWTITGAPDYSGLVCSQRFHGIWPTKDLPIELLAAVLVGPIANTIIGLQVTSRDNQKRVVGAVPIPSLTLAEIDSIVALVREYQAKRQQWLKKPLSADVSEQACHQLLLEIDAAALPVMTSPRLEREVLDCFVGQPRPGPVRFNGYYPSGFLPAIPLRRYISEEYRNSAAHLTLQRLTPIDDPAVSAMIKDLV